MIQDWIETHARLQEAFHPASERVPGTEGWRRYVEYNFTAAVLELAEVAGELEIRPWKVPTGVVKHKMALATEVVDVMHFLANILNAAGVTDAEFEMLYRFKVQENERRLASGRSVPTTVRSHDDDV